MLRSRYLLGLAGALLFSFSVYAAPHVAYKPVPVDKGIPTYKNTHTAGQVVWMTQQPTAAEKKGPVPKYAFTKLTFKKGSPPEFLIDRGYYPCSLKEARASIPKDLSAQDFAHATPVWVDGKQVNGSGASSVDDDTWERSELGLVYDGPIKTAMAEMEPGKHRITVWHQLNYNAWVMGNKGYHFWDDRYIALAKGTLEIDVLPAD